jgi:hypothetical protein
MRTLDFHKKVLRRIFVRKGEEVAGNCKKWHNKEIHNIT